MENMRRTAAENKTENSEPRVMGASQAEILFVTFIVEANVKFVIFVIKNRHLFLTDYRDWHKIAADVYRTL